MKKILYTTIIITSLLLNGIIVACSLPSNPQEPTQTPEAFFTPTQTLTPLPSATPSATPTPEFAPFCEPGATSASSTDSCKRPMAEQNSAFCEKKGVYNLITLNPGVTYEVLNDGFVCTDAGMKDGKQMITCTGPMSSTFSIKVCDPACEPPTAEALVTKCPETYVYDKYNGCCTQEFQTIGQNCEFLTLETTSCVVDCSEYTKQAQCQKNFYACEWNDAEQECQARK